MTIILGIDPGSRVTGYGLLKQADKQLEYIDSGCIRTPDGDLSDRLLAIYKGIQHLMHRFQPQEIAIEQVFMHQNANTALKLGHARGVAMIACAAVSAVKIQEYSARAIKQAVVGYGAAQKDQVKHMVTKLLALNALPQNDAADALAVAICHCHQKHLSFIGKSRVRRRRFA